MKCLFYFMYVVKRLVNIYYSTPNFGAFFNFFFFYKSTLSLSFYEYILFFYKSILFVFFLRRNLFEANKVNVSFFLLSVHLSCICYGAKCEIHSARMYISDIKRFYYFV